MITEYLKRYGVAHLLKWGLKAGAEVIEGSMRSVIPSAYQESDRTPIKIFEPVATSGWQGKIKILGVDVCPEHVDYTVDPITGRVHPLHHYKLLKHELRFALMHRYMQEGTDVKRVWDASRLQYVIVKPTATNYERTKKVILRWFTENPPDKGINWAVPMEVAIRGINLVLYYHVFESFLRHDEKFRKVLVGAVTAHGEYLWKERWAEFGPVRGNHYNSDMLGLMVLGAFLGVERWFKHGRDALEREMEVQVWDDGVSWEVSTNYHRLNTEIFTIAAVVASKAGNPFPEWWLKKLHRMHLFLAWMTKPNGLAPLIGDNDSGRIINPELNRDSRDFRDVIDVGAVLFRDGRLKLRERAGQLLGILLGRKGLETFKKIGQKPIEGAAHFETSGYVVVKGGQFYFITRCGPMGMKGTGGHAHNDILSFELYDSGDVVVDPGMPCYTSCPEKRNFYRSTAMHNTVMVDGIEQNKITNELFKLFEEVRGTHIRVRRDRDTTVVEGEYKLHRAGIVHKRSFRIRPSTGEVRIEDVVLGSGTHAVQLFFITPHRPELVKSNRVKVGNHVITYPNGWEALVEKTAISPAYGKEAPAHRISITKSSELPVKVETVIKRCECCDSGF